VHARRAGGRFGTEVLGNTRAMRLIGGYTAHSWELLGMWSWVPAFLTASFRVSGAAALRAMELGAYLAAGFHMTGLVASSSMGGLSDRLGRRTVLLSFGGVGMPGLSPASFAHLREYQLVLTGPAGSDPAPPNLRRLEGEALAAVALGYIDLVGAADVVVSKPGYGIVSDCIGAGTRLVYTDRGDFPEYPILVREMGRYLPAVHVGNDDVRSGRLREAVERVLSLPLPTPPDLSGAEVAARRLLEVAAR